MNSIHVQSDAINDHIRNSGILDRELSSLTDEIRYGQKQEKNRLVHTCMDIHKLPDN